MRHAKVVDTYALATVTRADDSNSALVSGSVVPLGDKKREHSVTGARMIIQTAVEAEVGPTTVKTTAGPVTVQRPNCAAPPADPPRRTRILRYTAPSVFPGCAGAG